MLKKIKSKKEILIIVIVVILMMIPLISENYIDGGDTKFHMSNILARYTQTISGDIMGNKVLPLIANKFGYGTGIFYPPMAHISAAILAVILGGNVTVSLKIIHFIVYLISALMMYKLVNSIFKNKFVALISAIFYITFPYSITEVFSRDALAESFIFMFMPMVLLALYELFNGDKKKFYLWFVVGYVGLINSHLVLAVYFTILVMIYLFINIKKVFTKDNLKALIISSVIILLIVSPFIVPMLQHKMLKIYEVFEGESMSNRGTIISSSLRIGEFFVQKPSDRFSNITYYMNLLALVMVGITIILHKSILKKEEERNFFKFLIILTVITTFLISNLCPWIFAPKIMIMIQFAWRLETILILALSILAALSTRNLKSKKSKIVVLLIVLGFNAYTVIRAYDFEKIIPMNINDEIISYYGMGWEKEYLPTKTINNIEYFNNRTQDVILKEGNADIEILENNTPHMKIKIDNVNEKAIIELPRIYYLGYDLVYTNNKGEKQKLEYNIDDKGFIETNINQNGILDVSYTGTLANKICDVLSIVTIIGAVGIYVWTIKKEKNNS